MWGEDSIPELDVYAASDSDDAMPSAGAGGRAREIEGSDEHAGPRVERLDDAEDDEDDEVHALVVPGATVNGSRRVLKAHVEARRLVREARMRADEMLREAHDQIALLHGEAENLRDDLDDLRGELAQRAEERAAALAQLEEARVTRERVEYDAGRRAARVMAQATAEAAAIRSRAEQERSEVEATMQRLRREHAAFEVEAGAIRANMRDEIEHLRAEAEVLREELVALRTEVAEALEEEGRIRQQLREARAATERAEEARREAERLVAGTMAEAEVLRANAARAQADAQADLDRLRATSTGCQHQVDVLREEVRGLGEELVRARQAATDARHREHESVQHLEELRATAGRIEQEARAEAKRLIREAHAEADVIRSAASQILREARAEAERIRTGVGTDRTASEMGPSAGQGTISDRLIGLQWDTSPRPAPSDDGADKEGSRRGAPAPFSAPNADDTADNEAPIDPKREALEKVADLGRELTAEIERRISEMAATLDERVTGEATDVAARAPAREDAIEAASANDRRGAPSDAGDILEHVRFVVAHELERMTGAASSVQSGDTPRGGEVAAENGESPQPLIGSGGWYAAVAAMTGHASEASDDQVPEQAVAIERSRRLRGGRFRRS